MRRGRKWYGSVVVKINYPHFRNIWISILLYNILRRFVLLKCCPKLRPSFQITPYTCQPSNRRARGHLPRKLRDTEIAPRDLRHVRKAASASLTIGNRTTVNDRRRIHDGRRIWSYKADCVFAIPLPRNRVSHHYILTANPIDLSSRDYSRGNRARISNDDRTRRCDFAFIRVFQINSRIFSRQTRHFSI